MIGLSIKNIWFLLFFHQKLPLLVTQCCIQLTFFKVRSPKTQCKNILCLYHLQFYVDLDFIFKYKERISNVLQISIVYGSYQHTTYFNFSADKKVTVLFRVNIEVTTCRNLIVFLSFSSRFLGKPKTIKNQNLNHDIDLDIKFLLLDNGR